MNNFIKLLFVSGLLISACSNNKEETTFSEQEDMLYMKTAPESRMMSSIPEPPSENIDAKVVDKKKIIKDGRMGIKVDDLDASKSRVDGLVQSYKGYYGNEGYNNTDYESSYNLQIRVPAESFEKLIAEIEAGAGEVNYKDINSRDVTDQFIDMETRLASKRAYHLRYSELLKQAKTVKDILEIEERMRMLQEEIESTEGRLKYLNDQVSYSTLHLSISKPKDFVFKPGDRMNFLERLKQALSRGWYGFVDLVLFLIKIWPLWIVLIIAWTAWRAKRKNVV
jgi:uncharacterized small protein (DUF1192 family)